MAESNDAITGKFDFYDILGYLTPGLVFLGLLFLPFGLFKGIWLSTNITAAVLYLVSAHILGHILQGFLRSWETVPQIRDKKGEMRSPSSVLLDADQESLARVRGKIGKLVAKFWEIPSHDLLAEDHDSDRNAAFLLARNLLLQSKKQSYIEQFQGKYALLGGMTAGLLLASAYYAGWALALIPSSLVASWAEWAPYVFGALVVLFVIYLSIVQGFEGSVKFPRMILVFFLVIQAALGGLVVAGASYQTAETHKDTCPTCAVCCSATSPEGTSQGHNSSLRIEHKATFILILALAAFGAAVRCYGGYKTFAREFAMGVWRDFANSDLVAADSGKG